MAIVAAELQDELPVTSLATLQGRPASASKMPTVCSKHARSLEAMIPGMNDASEGTSVSQLVRRKSGSSSGLVHVHKLSLRGFRELDEQQNSTANVQHPPSLYRRPRSASMASVSTSASTTISQASPRPRPKEAMQAEFPSNEHEPHNRVLSASRGSNTAQRSTSNTPNPPCLCPRPPSSLMPPSRSSSKPRPKDSAQMDLPNSEDELGLCGFEELDAEQQRNQRRSDDAADECQSLLNVRMSRRREASRPASPSRSSSRLSPNEDLAHLRCSVNGVRPLSGTERKQRKQDTVDWFRAAQDINNSCRPLEEADALLAAARSRRTSSDSFGTGVRSRSASRTRQVSPTAEVAEEVADGNGTILSVAAPPRLCVDPVALWSAKAVAAAAKQKPPVAPTAAHGARRMHTINGEGVAFGPEGASSLRSRLSRRSVSSEPN